MSEMSDLSIAVDLDRQVRVLRKRLEEVSGQLAEVAVERGVLWALLDQLEAALQRVGAEGVEAMAAVYDVSMETEK